LADTLRVRRLDSPLRRAEPETSPSAPLAASDADTSDAGRNAPQSDTRTAKPSRRRVRHSERPELPAAAAVLATGTEPPPLDERLELISARLPESLAHRPAQIAAKLRQRDGGASQKSLPTQELIAVALWATMGDPDDPQAVEAFERLLRDYRGRRYTAAGSRLRPEG
jgi:hypothetical protein